MFYVVVRDIENGTRRDACAFVSREESRSVYEKAKRVCDNDPDEFGDGDPTIVSQCWLYEVGAPDAEQAVAMAREGHGRRVASHPEEDFSPIFESHS